MKILNNYLSFLFSNGRIVYFSIIAGEWFKDGKGNIPLMIGLYFLRYFFWGSIRGSNITGNHQKWEEIGLAIIDIILPFYFLYLLIM